MSSSGFSARAQSAAAQNTNSGRVGGITSGVGPGGGSGGHQASRNSGGGGSCCVM